MRIYCADGMMRAMRLNSRLPIAIIAITGSVLAASACQSNSSASGSASSSPSAPASSQAPSSSTGGSSTGGSSTGGSSTGGSSTGGSSTGGGSGTPGVIDCGTSDTTLEHEPTTITLDCGDAGEALKNLQWNSWGASSASGSGNVAVQSCTPNCASGGTKEVPAGVTLSGVQSSSQGSYFSHVSLSWDMTKPPGVATSYTLQGPGGA